MSSAVQNILERALGDVARATKYEVFFAFTDPKSSISKDDLVAMGRTASFPGKQHTTIDLKFKGRSIPIKGQTKYTQTWECTFYLTEDHKLKNAFENWIEALDQKHNYYDVSQSPSVPSIQAQHNADSYTTDLFIYQRNFNDDANMAEYELKNAFPIEVSPIQTSYESRGQIQEFTVTFAYSHFVSKVLKGAQGNFIDEIYGKVLAYGMNFIGGSLSSVGDSVNSFVSDATGNSLNELNAWSAGLSSDFNFSADVLGSLTENQASQAMGAGINSIPAGKSLIDVIEGKK